MEDRPLMAEPVPLAMLANPNYKGDPPNTGTPAVAYIAASVRARSWRRDCQGERRQQPAATTPFSSSAHLTWALSYVVPGAWKNSAYDPELPGPLFNADQIKVPVTLESVVKELSKQAIRDKVRHQTG